MAQAGLAGASLGPAGALAFCFDKNQEVERKGGVKIVSQLTTADSVLAADPSTKEKYLTRVTQVTILTGSFPAHKVTLSSGHVVTVTSPHLMLVFKPDGPVMLPARSLAVGDLMHAPASGPQPVAVTEIKDLTLDTKVNVETASGTLIANGVLVSAMCEKYPEVPAAAASLIKEYTASHAPVVEATA